MFLIGLVLLNDNNPGPDHPVSVYLIFWLYIILFYIDDNKFHMICDETVFFHACKSNCKSLSALIKESLLSLVSFLFNLLR